MQSTSATISTLEIGLKIRAFTEILRDVAPGECGLRELPSTTVLHPTTSQLRHVFFCTLPCLNTLDTRCEERNVEINQLRGLLRVIVTY